MADASMNNFFMRVGLVSGKVGINFGVLATQAELPLPLDFTI